MFYFRPVSIDLATCQRIATRNSVNTVLGRVRGSRRSNPGLPITKEIPPSTGSRSANVHARTKDEPRSNATASLRQLFPIICPASVPSTRRLHRGTPCIGVRASERRARVSHPLLRNLNFHPLIERKRFSAFVLVGSLSKERRRTSSFPLVVSCRRTRMNAARTRRVSP